MPGYLKELMKTAQANGKSDEDINKKGQMTALQRIHMLVDEGTFCPLNSIFNPEDNNTGSTSIVKGLDRVNGKWCVIIALDSKKLERYVCRTCANVAYERYSFDGRHWICNDDWICRRWLVLLWKKKETNSVTYQISP